MYTADSGSRHLGTTLSRPSSGPAAGRSVDLCSSIQQDDGMSDVEVQVSETMAATPDVIYELISDLPRMGEWSPENLGGAAVGAKFRGDNRNGRKSWSTTVTITTADPGRALAFDVTFGPFSVARWRYTLVGDGATTVVTETWWDCRNPVLRVLGGPFSGVSDRPGHNRVGMQATLAAVKRTAEATSPTSDRSPG
jgi:hypothetical protein